MNTLEKFKISEDFKNYFGAAINADDEFGKLSKEAIDEAGPLIADTHEHFQAIRKEKNDVEAVRYLWDVCGYYMVLCGDLIRHNKTMVALLKEAMERLPDDETPD